MAWHVLEVLYVIICFEDAQPALFDFSLVSHPLSLSCSMSHTDNEFFFIDSDAKLSKVAPEGWKEDPKKRKLDVPFIFFLRIKFFIDDVNLIQ